MRLVNADALKAKAFGKRGGLIHTSDIDAAPTVDAVPVVHCCECKYVGTDATCCLVCDREGMGLRPFHVHHDDFCSYGKKDGDNHG